LLKNAEGVFIEPTLKSVSAAAAGAHLGPDSDFRVSITNAPGKDSYPICSFTWLLVQPQPRDSTKGRLIHSFLLWMLEPEAQRMAADLHYAPLPASVIELLQRKLGAK
jgi:phosphate transport system substrate-binding protein